MSCFNIKENLFNKYKSSLHINIGGYNEFKQLYFEEYHNKRVEILGNVCYDYQVGDYYCHIIVDGHDNKHVLANFIKFFTLAKNNIILDDDLFDL